jgi:hypothetical protein
VGAPDRSRRGQAVRALELRGARALGAYDEFVGRLHKAAFRQALEAVTRETSGDSAEFAKTEEIGKELQGGLLALLYEASPGLAKVVRDYAIF